jgi:hypothetical protein
LRKAHAAEADHPLASTLGLEWLTEPFFAALSGKNLPRQHDQQDLIAGLNRTSKTTKPLKQL